MIFCLFLGGDFLCGPHEPANPARMVSNREPMHLDPSLFAKRTDDAESFVEQPGLSGFLKFSEHVRAVFRVDEFFVGSWIVKQRLARASGDRLVGFVHVEGPLGFRVNHPEDFPNVARHLLESLFACTVLSKCPSQEPRTKQNNDAETCRHSDHQRARDLSPLKFGAKHCKRQTNTRLTD